MIVWSNNFRKGQVESNAPWHSQLINGNVGVSRDDSTRREVNTLAHEVSTHPPRLALETLPNGKQWSARSLQSNRLLTNNNHWRLAVDTDDAATLVDLKGHETNRVWGQLGQTVKCPYCASTGVC